MRIVDKRGKQQPPKTSDSDEQQVAVVTEPGNTAGELQRTEVAAPPTPETLKGLIKTPDIGEKFWLHDVQFQIVEAAVNGLVIVPVGLSKTASKRLRRSIDANH